MSIDFSNDDEEAYDVDPEGRIAGIFSVHRLYLRAVLRLAARCNVTVSELDGTWTRKHLVLGGEFPDMVALFTTLIGLNVNLKVL